ncbi:MAG: hypothetical protein LBR13_06505, partial [Dysgonamonadaceae bacterium]|nr:hypothetical protein [Dysgonamonadaceae bacterium]
MKLSIPLHKIAVYALIAVFTAITGEVFPQILRTSYPIQATAALLPPNSLYLQDYCNSTREKVVL